MVSKHAILLGFIIGILAFTVIAADMRTSPTIQSLGIPDIKGESLEKQITLRSQAANRLRFYYDESELNLKLKTFIEAEEPLAVFTLTSKTLKIDEQFNLAEFDQKLFDIDNNSMIDFSILIDKINLTGGKRRVTLTFRTETFDVSDEKTPTDEPEIKDKDIPKPEDKPETIKDTRDASIGDASNENNELEFFEEEQKQHTPQKNVMSKKGFNILATLIIIAIIIGIITIFSVINKKKIHI